MLASSSEYGAAVHRYQYDTVRNKQERRRMLPVKICVGWTQNLDIYA